MKMELPISESIEVEVSIVVIDCENPPLFPFFLIIGKNNSVLEINMFSIPISSGSAFFYLLISSYLRNLNPYHQTSNPSFRL